MNNKIRWLDRLDHVCTDKHIGIHGRILEQKICTCQDLKPIKQKYDEYRYSIRQLKIKDKESVEQAVDLLNQYRSAAIPVFESRINSGQETLRSSILEEFFTYLFKDLVIATGVAQDATVVGKDHIYVSLSFTPRTFTDLAKQPKPYVHTKDQDFVLGCITELRVASPGIPMDEVSGVQLTIPVIAIECKTYIERNMLDTCAGTARRLKSAMPYCLYMVVAEYLKLDEGFPELTDIDEVYILCRAKNCERETRKKSDQELHQIHSDLVFDIFEKVDRHLNRIWWDPGTALERGKVIGRP